MAPFGALNGQKCQSILHWDEVGEGKLLGPDFVQQTEEKIKLILNHLRTTQSLRTSFADRNRKWWRFPWEITYS